MCCLSWRNWEKKLSFTKRSLSYVYEETEKKNSLMKISLSDVYDETEKKNSLMKRSLSYVYVVSYICVPHPVTVNNVITK